MAKDRTIRHLTTFKGKVRRAERERAAGHRGMVVWLTGLSGSGKSTVAHEVEKSLFDAGLRVYVFDGDNVRKGLCSDLGFSPSDRAENVRRIGEATRLFADAGIICLCAFVSPMRAARETVRSMHAPGDFAEVHVKCPVSVCASRDVKGYYQMAFEGRIKNYTGVSAPYEEPEHAELVLDTDVQTLEESVAALESFVLDRALLRGRDSSSTVASIA